MESVMYLVDYVRFNSNQNEEIWVYEESDINDEIICGKCKDIAKVLGDKLSLSKIVKINHYENFKKITVRYN